MYCMIYERRRMKIIPRLFYYYRRRLVLIELVYVYIVTPLVYYITSLQR